VTALERAGEGDGDGLLMAEEEGEASRAEGDIGDD